MTKAWNKMSKEEKLEHWNKMSKEEKIAHFQNRIDEVIHQLYVDGKHEWVRDYYGDYEVFRYNKDLSDEEIQVLKDKLRQAYNGRNFHLNGY